MKITDKPNDTNQGQSEYDTQHTRKERKRTVPL